MLLYHGTSEANARAILASGAIEPRGQGAGNWVKNPSAEECVYLTTSYAGYFGLAAIPSGKLSTDRVAVFEVDVARLRSYRMRPDEDFVEYATRGTNILKGKGIRARTASARKALGKFAHAWKLSLDHLGTAAHHGAIPLMAVTRYALFTPKAAPEVAQMLIDPCITPLNYRFCGDRYREITRWIFEGNMDLDRLFGIGGAPLGAMLTDVKASAPLFSNEVWSASCEVHETGIVV